MRVLCVRQIGARNPMSCPIRIAVLRLLSCASPVRRPHGQGTSRAPLFNKQGEIVVTHKHAAGTHPTLTDTPSP